MKRIGLAVLASVLIGLPATACAQAKIGFVNSDRVMREASPAVAAQKRLEKEFEARDRELQAQGKRLQGLQEDLERNGMTMSPEDRRNEELAAVLDRANKAIKEIAERDGFDIIFQEAVYASTRIDITDQVIKALAAGK